MKFRYRNHDSSPPPPYIYLNLLCLIHTRPVSSRLILILSSQVSPSFRGGSFNSFVFSLSYVPHAWPIVQSSISLPQDRAGQTEPTGGSHNQLWIRLKAARVGGIEFTSSCYSKRISQAESTVIKLSKMQNMIGFLCASLNVTSCTFQTFCALINMPYCLIQIECVQFVELCY